MASLQVVCSFLVFLCVTDLALGQGGYRGRRRGGGHIFRCPQVRCRSGCPGGDYVYDSNGCQTCSCRTHILPRPPRPAHSRNCPRNDRVTICVVRRDQCTSDLQCHPGEICCPQGCNSVCVSPNHRPNRRRIRNRGGRGGRRVGSRWQNPRY